ncbi:TonB-dependent receptor [Chitinophaga horti]|uniref:TonB-dependent receptor n=1 Tax=Chitinophaga horti TaxID=2920382 RepID=A0ABY6J976_9BACT|nr:TonB-dependent receptor [Chitinophaga horti]UYQ94877.1 TonB-dependent receptor [Chitinophaga horti]
MKKIYLFFLLLLATVHWAQAQTRTIRGKVTDAGTGAGLPFVSVQLKGSTTGAKTDENGNFSLTVPAGKADLQFTYMGYLTITQPHEGNANVVVKMEKDDKKLDEVVVIGYGQVRKRDLTGAVVSVKGEELRKIPSTNVMESVQGKVPGVDITKSSGASGAKINVTVRGNRSITAGNSPLYIVDGIQYGNIEDINPNDIQSMEVLKDASSTAIYGSRGANGVIIVTTKRGSTGKAQVSFNAYGGISEVAGYPKMNTGPEYVALKREANRTNNRWNSPADDPAIFNAMELAAIRNDLWTSYADELIQKGQQQDYQLGVAAGSEKTKIYLSLDYFKEKGLFKLDNLQRYTARMNVDQQVGELLKVGMQGQVTYYDQNARRDPLNQGNKIIPLGRPYDSSGNFVAFPNAGPHINPLADEQPGAYQNNSRMTRTLVNVYAELQPIKDLSFRTNLGISLDNSRTGVYAARLTIDRATTSTSRAQYNTSQTRFLNWENIISYKKELKNHSFGITAISSLLGSQAESSNAQGEGQLLPSQLFHALQNNVSGIAIRTTYQQWNLVSFTGRLNYAYQGKYLLTLTGRSDGSSKLAQGNQWAFFPSVAGAWRISDEAFMKKQTFISDLKLRVSYGIAGNDAVAPYGTQSVLFRAPFSYDDNTAAMAYSISDQLGNRQLAWELTGTTDIGLDFGLFDNRISANIDYYDSHTSDLLLMRRLPTSTGVEKTLQNIGKTRNNGVEIGLNTVNFKTADFSWTTNISFTRNKERIVSLADGSTNDIASGLFIGYPVNVYFDYDKVGIWQSKDVDAATRYKAKVGDIRVRDVVQDSVINSEDRVVLGAQVPRWSGGINNDIRWKSFDLNIYVFARIGQWINSEYAAKYDPQGLENSGKVDYWTPENPTNAYPRPNSSVSMSGTPFISTLGYRDGSFIKIRNVSLGYSLPSEAARRIRMSALRVYVTGKNLATFSKVKDYDPERGGQLSFPLTRMYVAGLNVTF